MVFFLVSQECCQIMQLDGDFRWRSNMDQLVFMLFQVVCFFICLYVLVDVKPISCGSAMKTETTACFLTRSSTYVEIY